MDPDGRFVEIVQGRGGVVQLDEWTALVGVCFDREAGLDSIDAVRTALDDLAGECPPNFAGMLRRLFGPAGFRGNTVDYGDPRNSYLHQVMRRGVGIPITLSVVAMEVGRRLALPVQGIGLPGHFVVACRGEYADPFHGPDRYDRPGIEAVWQRTTGIDRLLSPGFLAPVSDRSIVVRMLNNLKQTFVAMDDPIPLRTLAHLRGAFKELAAEEDERARWVRHWN